MRIEEQEFMGKVFLKMSLGIIYQFHCDQQLLNKYNTSLYVIPSCKTHLEIPKKKHPSIFIKKDVFFKKKNLHKIYSNLNSHQYEGGDIMKRKRRDHLTCLNCSIHLFTCEMTRFGNHWLFRLFVETMSLSIIDCNSPPKPQVMFTFWKRYLLQ